MEYTRLDILFTPCKNSQDGSLLIALSRPASLLVLSPPWEYARVIDLSTWFSVSYRNPGTFQMAVLGRSHNVVLFDGHSMMVVDALTGSARLLPTFKQRLSNLFSDGVPRAILCPAQPSADAVVTFVPGERSFTMWKFDTLSTYTASLPSSVPVHIPCCLQFPMHYMLKNDRFL